MSNPSHNAASVVALSILLSRVIGFLRERVVAFFFGVGAHADVFQTAFRGPNLLQNLLGEGTISAVFIPIYSRMLEEGREEEAGRFAGAIFGLLLAVVSLAVLLGVVFAEPVIAILAPGFLNDAQRVASGELSVNRYEMAVRAVRIMFPMTGVLVLSAWALGILNSHRRFFLAYIAPVLWNTAIIAGLAGTAYLLGSGSTAGGGGLSLAQLDKVLRAAFLGALAGAFLQLAVQLPLVFRLAPSLRLSFSTRVPGVREALALAGPVLGGRGAYQLSAYLDLFLASFLAVGALSSLRYAQMLYFLPVSLFGGAIAVSELPELSRLDREGRRAFLGRVQESLRQMVVMTVPTVVGFLVFGYLMVAGLFQTGRFSAGDNWLVYLVLAGYSVGLLATSMSRLLQNAFYALQDARTPAKAAVFRVLLSTASAVPLMVLLDRLQVSRLVGDDGLDSTLRLGALGLALGTSAGAWLELYRLTSALRRQLDDFGLPWAAVIRTALLALAAGLPSLLLWRYLVFPHVVIQSAAVLILYAAVYLLLARRFGPPEIARWLGRFRLGPPTSPTGR